MSCGVEMIEPTERMPTVPSVSLLPVLPAETVNTILTALMSAEGALDLVYRKTSIETYGHALAQVRVALNDFADLLAWRCAPCSGWTALTRRICKALDPVGPPVLRALSLCTCRATTPAQRLELLLRSLRPDAGRSLPSDQILLHLAEFE